jgi:hypothetical protein
MPLKDPIERKEYDKKYYKKNKNKRKQTSKLWAQNNRESYNKNSNKSYYKNREKVIKRNMEYERKKLKTDMKLVLRKRLANRLWKALKGKGKSKSTMDLLGVPHFDFLKTWIECKFKEGMTWENRQSLAYRSHNSLFFF